MLLVYTHQITTRLNFVFKHIVTRILQEEVEFTTKVEEFINHQGLKMSYTRQPLGKELFIQSHHILFEEGVSDVSIAVENWKQTKCFFAVGEKSHLPFDIFAASFYLMSRYEEYLPHVNDGFGRFPPEESIAYKYHFLQQPVVDIWSYEFLKVLSTYFPDHEFTAREFKITPIIDVPVAYEFINKGLIRTIGGTIRDLFRFKFTKLYQRYAVLFKLRKDPYDSFKWLINNHKKRKIEAVFFFLLGDYTHYDKSISHTNDELIALIKYVADYFPVGLKGSYLALEDKEMLNREKKRFEAILNKPMEMNRNSFSKLMLPFAYRNLIDLEIETDYTMGYVSEAGFRAGTCTPYYFYDLDYETQTPLKVHPFCALDFLYRGMTTEQASEAIMKLVDAVKSVDGHFSMVVHNYTFSEDDEWIGWRKIYTNLLDSINR